MGDGIGACVPPFLATAADADAPMPERYWLGVDLVIEVVSPDDPDRDLVEKRVDYAEAGIPEYWIVDPRNETITVLALDGDAYRDLGVFGAGDTAQSRVLGGFSADVRSVFDAPKPDA